MSSVRANSTRRRARPSGMASASDTHTIPGVASHPGQHRTSHQRGRSASAVVRLVPRDTMSDMDAAASVESSPVPVAYAPMGEPSQPCILIVEDDPRAAHAIRETLTLEGEPNWNIQVAEGGERALALAAAQPPHVVLLDVGLPDLDGAEVYRRLRTHPQTSASHVLFLTAATSLDLYQRGVDAGVVLRKPFEMRELVGLVRTLIAS